MTDRFDSMDDHGFEPKQRELRRFEVITGTGRRRRWTDEAKARIVAESFAADTSISAVARHYEISPQQLFTWRREARQGRLPLSGEAAAFVPIVTGRSAGGDAPPGVAAMSVEIELRGVVVRVYGRVEAAALAEVLSAVKRVR
jgi:transposase